MDKFGSKKVGPIRIGVFAAPGFALMSYASTIEPFRAANLLSGRELYQVVHYGATDDPVPSSGPALVHSHGRFDDKDLPDYLFVVAGGDPLGYRDTTVFAWLRRLARQGVILGGVSGGPVILARAQLMTGRRMTVHWEHASALKEIAPDLLIERSLYVTDQDRLTCAGGVAALDMMHELIARHHGAQFARLVSDWFLHTDIRPPVGAQRGALQARVGTANRTVLDAVKAMEKNLSDRLSLADLAASIGVSPRQLNRLFQAHVGRSVGQYYLRARLEHAASLLRNSSLSVTEVALMTGFATVSHFSGAFSKAFGAPPSHLRASVDLPNRNWRS